jgi:hypothetical protein
MKMAVSEDGDQEKLPASFVGISIDQLSKNGKRKRISHNIY